MINKAMFNKKLPYKCYCDTPELIENYEKAIADSTQTWECHHRFEALFTRQELIKYNWYFNVEPSCLIFLTPTEHKRIHKVNKTTWNSKKVLCIETGEIFESTLLAERKTGVSQSTISRVCNNKKQKTAGGFHWRFV